MFDNNLGDGLRFFSLKLSLSRMVLHLFEEFLWKTDFTHNRKRGFRVL